MIPLLGFAPDLDETTPGVITDCTNFVPTLNGYRGGASGADVGMDALAAAALSSAVCTKLDGTNRLFAGTATALYEKSSSSWTDRSRATSYNATTTNPWRFAQFGNTTLAINKGDVLQSIAAGTDFADVATAPKAGVMCIVSGFVMLGNTNDGSNDDLDRWWCSAYLDETDWTTAIATQCTSGRLVDTPGAITGMKALGYNCVAYKANSLYLGQYVGAPVVWDFTLVPGDVGCASHDGIADIGSAHIFIGAEDIYSFNGAQVQPIGAPVREWFFADVDPAYLSRIKAAHDRVNARVYFYYPRKGNAGALNGCLVYNYKTNKFGLAHRSVEAVVEYVSGGYTWDTLPVIGSSWDNWPAVPWDSPFWTASSKTTAYIGTDHTIYSLTGASSTSSFITGSFGEEDKYSLLGRVTLRYLSRPDSATMTNSYQEYLGGDWTADATTTESSGRFDVLRSSVFHKAEFSFTGDYEVVGMTAEIKPDGVL